MSKIYDELFERLKYSVQDLVNNSETAFSGEAVRDGNYILAELRNDIEDWSQMLINADIDEGNFKSLLFAEKDKFKMMALRKAGLTTPEIEDFKNEIFNLINFSVPQLSKEINKA